ncbi:hypothetical protein DPSP01_004030 [Paraphaeosphaeria sporulosa]|uniref:Uncharacterized protein n=1 Tax=Paraphaeosphaeria sporulosa TaxID=1460663 RepID=A0A177CUM0_9PLEO|nr:uncharacterized protein CC84DRAFT_497058 [Paraphaeosphaeria sporulosa]OAG10901.1 hypothetical protein CC84DRAFT_497058 [Paraphaeosphaeria sporulosa]
MAATEYYMGTAAAQQLGHIRPPAHELPGHQQLSYQHSQPANQIQPYNERPPTYSPYPAQQQQPRPQQTYQPQQYQQRPQGHQQPYPLPPASYSPRPTSQPRPQRYPQPQPQSALLGVPLQHHRSHSQPPRVRFADRDEYSTDSGSYTSDSSASRRRHKKHHHHHHHRRSSDHDSRDRGYDSEPRSEPRNAHSKSRKNRDTFLGAGAGGVIGDAIFPGLGTVGGLLLGGYGGRKRASKKEEDREWEAESDADSARKHGRNHKHRHHREYDDGGYAGEGRHKHHRGGESGWDEESRTYRKGLAVR